MTEHSRSRHPPKLGALSRLLNRQRNVRTFENKLEMEKLADIKLRKNISRPFSLG